MTRLPKIMVSFALGVGCMVGLYWMLAGQSPDLPVPVNGVSATGRQMDADALEREVRGELPVGSSLVAVQRVLTNHGLGFNFEAQSRTVFAIARGLPGSTVFANKSLTFKFHFDDGLALKSIDTEVLYTGP